MTLQNNVFLTFGQLMRQLFIELFHLSNLLEIPNDQNGQCWVLQQLLYKGISFNDGSQLVVVNFLWPAVLHSSSSRLLSPLQNFLNHYCTVCLLAVLGSNALLMLWVVFAALQPILTSNKKTAQICFLTNIISTVQNIINNVISKKEKQEMCIKMMCKVTSI